MVFGAQAWWSFNPELQTFNPDTELPAARMYTFDSTSQRIF